MAQTYTNLLYHIIFSTKNREPFIDAELLQPLHAYMGGILLEIDAQPLIVGGVVDHVHALARLPKMLLIPDALRVLKTNSSRWVHEKYPHKASFAWQTGYAAFTVGQGIVEDVRRYIADQERHHQKVSFQDECRAFLRRNGMEFDERYMWE
jgi:putative transposase